MVKILLRQTRKKITNKNMEKKIYKCLVASPGDTKEERQICLKIFNELNKGLGESFGFVIEERMWEHNTRPSFSGDYSQATISDQLGNDYDLFVGIMNNKFGTETKVAGSGTEEEFNNAYQRFKNKESLDIMFYFNDAPVKKSELNSDDFNKVNKFREKVAELGGYYWTYIGVSDFENTFRTHLTDYFVKLYSKEKKGSTKANVQFEVLRAKFKSNLDNALQAFSSQPIIWVDPVISNTNEISQNPDENYTRRIDVIEIINNPESIVFNAPPQFGLTSLAHYMVLQSWERGNFWLYLDSHNTKSHNIHNAVVRETESLGLKITDVKAIILDSWNSYELDSFKKLKNLSESYKDIAIILMHTIEDAKFLKEPNDIKIEREFKQLFLLALPRTQIRKVVAEYNRVKEIGIEDNVLTKVVSDLDVLNIHRTPMNCLTLLKVSEKYFDESPINRTDMIEKVLFVLFNMDGIPRYKTKPDLKDCEYVLGRYCEMMIRTDKYNFSRDTFIKELKSFCKEKLIDLDVDVVFDVLVLNHIIVKQEFDYCFRSSFWVYYFAAKRMDNDKEFADYIFASKKYISFPEIIEFYTGIDRNKIDALEILTKDIKETCDIVNSKVRLTGDMNIFSQIRWQPTEEQIYEGMKMLLTNPDIPAKIKKNLETSIEKFDNEKIYEEVTSVFIKQFELKR